MAILTVGLALTAWEVRPSFTEPATPPSGWIALTTRDGSGIPFKTLNHVRKLRKAPSIKVTVSVRHDVPSSSTPDAVDVVIQVHVGSTARRFAAPWAVTVAFPDGADISGPEGNAPVRRALSSSACDDVRSNTVGHACELLRPDSDQPTSATVIAHYAHPSLGTLSTRSGRLAIAFPGFSVDERFLSGVPIHINMVDTYGPIGDDVTDAGPPPDVVRGPHGTSESETSLWRWSPTGDREIASLIVPAAHSSHADRIEHRNEFVTGVLLGLAGGAFLAFLQEALTLYAHGGVRRPTSA